MKMQKLFLKEEIPTAIREYELLLKEAELEGNKALSTGYRHSGEVEKRTLEIYNRLGEQQLETEYYVCDFCGYIADGEPPDNCPICTAPRKPF